MKTKKIVLVIISVILLLLVSNCGTFGGEDISLKDGVLSVVPELRMDMPFNKVPQDWLPPYRDYNKEAIEMNALYDFRKSKEKIIEYEGVKFHTYFIFNGTGVLIPKNELDSKPIIKRINCEAREYVTKEQANKILESLTAHYGKTKKVNSSFRWEEGDYRLDIGYNHEGGFYITMYRYNDNLK